MMQQKLVINKDKKVQTTYLALIKKKKNTYSQEPVAVSLLYWDFAMGQWQEHLEIKKQIIATVLARLHDLLAARYTGTTAPVLDED